MRVFPSSRCKSASCVWMMAVSRPGRKSDNGDWRGGTTRTHCISTVSHRLNPWQSFLWDFLLCCDPGTPNRSPCVPSHMVGDGEGRYVVVRLYPEAIVPGRLICQHAGLDRGDIKKKPWTSPPELYGNGTFRIGAPDGGHWPSLYIADARSRFARTGDNGSRITWSEPPAPDDPWRRGVVSSHHIYLFLTKFIIFLKNSANF